MRPLLFIAAISAVVLGLGCDQKPVHETAFTPAQLVISVEEEPTYIRVISQRSGKEITPGIEIFTDGRCLVREFDGKEYEKQLQPDDVRGLLHYFEREGLFSISDESIDRALDRADEPTVVDLPNGGVQMTWPARSWTTHQNYTKIGAVSDSTNVWISRYDLAGEVGQYPTVTELKTVKRCVERVYEVAGRTPK